MPNDFLVYYRSTATGTQIATVNGALVAIGPGPVAQQPDDYFTATLNWGTSSKDRANLKGRLNTAANIVTAVNQAND